jgi:hypothetical protein
MLAEDRPFNASSVSQGDAGHVKARTNVSWHEKCPGDEEQSNSLVFVSAGEPAT